MKTKFMSNFRLIIILIFITSSFTSCQSQRKIEYNKAIHCYEVNEIESYIRKYPDDKEIKQLKFRLRVIEYEKVKNSNSIMLINYFIQKYKTGRDVEKVKDLIFNIKLNSKKQDLEYLNYLKTVFSEEKYIKIIDEKIYIILENKLSKIKIVNNDQEEEEVKNFIQNYPAKSLSAKLKKTLLDYRMIKILKTQNLNKINNFIQKYPQYYTKKVKNTISNIILTEYKKAPLKVLKRYMEDNKDHKNYAELEKSYKERAYNEYLSFYEYDKLINLDNKYKLEKYKKNVEWFKNNKEKVLNINKTIKYLYSPIPYTKEEEGKLYFITKDSIEESELILKSAFFTNDINVILKKVSSNFLLIQISALKALEYYYNQDIISRKIELIEKYKALEKIKGNFYKEKILLIALVINDQKLFFNYLKQLINEQNKTLWVNYLKFHFLETSYSRIINLIFDISKIDSQVVYSDKTLEKNRIDRKINLSITRIILNNVLSEIQKKNIISNKHTNSKINKLEGFLKDVKSFDFTFINNYENKKVKNLEKLSKEIKLNDFLKKDIINHSPITKIKNDLGLRNCNNIKNWCDKKNKLFKILLRN